MEVVLINWCLRQGSTAIVKDDMKKAGLAKWVSDGAVDQRSYISA
jgi:predicted transcriptional regulator